MLFGIILDDKYAEGNAQKTWRSKKSFVYLQGKYEKHIYSVNKIKSNEKN